MATYPLSDESERETASKIYLIDILHRFVNFIRGETVAVEILLKCRYTRFVGVQYLESK